MTKAVLVAFHQYTNFGSEYYRPIFDLFIKNYRTIWGKEVDKLYILASNWNVDYADDYVIIPTDPQLRYFDAYKAVLREELIKEDLIMFMDNDMVVYKPGQVGAAFEFLKPNPVDGKKYDVVSIYDTIGTMKVDLPNGKNKFCPYWFATRKDILMKYLDVDWSPDAMPYTETFGLLTEAMLNDGLRPYEFEEDKSNCLFDGIQDGEKSKNLGYYHIRSGSLPAYLLATKKYGDRETYDKYLQNQPRNEYLRQFAWYTYMLGNVRVDDSGWVHTEDVIDFLKDINLTARDLIEYMGRFVAYYGLV